jgi:hypothetical protein
MLDTIIRAGDVVTPQGVARCDVAISGETIAAVTAPSALPAEQARCVIDASGRIVMPEGIDRTCICIMCGSSLTAPADDGRPRTGGVRCPVRRHDHVHRFRLLAGWNVGARRRRARDRDFVGKSPCDRAYFVLVEGSKDCNYSGFRSWLCATLRVRLRLGPARSWDRGY